MDSPLSVYKLMHKGPGWVGKEAVGSITDYMDAAVCHAHGSIGLTAVFKDLFGPG
jgi:hypothetical protein